jgi:hypothetical protein
MKNNKKEGGGSSYNNISSSSNINVSTTTSGHLQEPTSKEMEHIPVEDLFNIAKDEGLLIALASKQQVQNGKSHKAPAINWDKPPKDYKGLHDPKYPTAIICDYINKLKRQLVVIDLDKPKKDGDIPLEVLKSVSLPLIENTYSVKTPSGGIHIYFLSKQQPKQSQPKVNIDYQTNTGVNKGKYVVANYRWRKDGKSKEKYTKLPESPNHIALVDNTDTGLENLLQKLVDSGHITTAKEEHQERIVSVLSRYYDEGTRDVYSCAIVGYLRKQGYEMDTVKEIISRVFNKDEELDKRLRNVEQTYNKPLNEIIGWKYLQEHLSKKDQETVLELTKTSEGNLKIKIVQTLAKNKEPTVKIVADFVNSHLELYKNLETSKYYERTPEGEITEIDDTRIIEFCNEQFGVNLISSKRCSEVLKFVTNPIKKNYDLVEFKNGILNTKTQEFTTDKELFNETPKLVLNINWNTEAEPGEIGQIINTILDSKEHPTDKERWLRSVGHAFMGGNRIGKLTMVQGQSNTGKSTLTTILKRLFNYSELPTRVINKNERFTLYGLIDKDVNIDDDINNGMLKSIGTLNTITTGNGLEVEVKGENKTIRAENHQIPRLFANGNTLPPVFGEGFRRRLLLIHADNKIPNSDKKDFLQGDIIKGEYDDKGLEWLVYTAITSYWDKKDEAITTEEDEAKMEAEYKFKSYPTLIAVETMFQDNTNGYSNIPVREVNAWVKAWHLWAYDNEQISKEHKRPSNKAISKAMDNASFDKRNIREDESLVTLCYIDLELKEDFRTLLEGYYMQMKRLEGGRQDKIK